MAVPLNAKRRARMEQMALAIHPSPTPTVLTLQSRTEPKMPLSGYEVFEFDKETKEADLARPHRLARPGLHRSGRGENAASAVDQKRRRTARPHAVRARLGAATDGRDRQRRLPASGRRLHHRISGGSGRSFPAPRNAHQGNQGENRSRRSRNGANHVRGTEPPSRRAKFIFKKLAEEKKKLDTKDPVVQKKIDKLFAETQKLVEKCLDEKSLEELDQELRDAKQAMSRSPKKANRPKCIRLLVPPPLSKQTQSAPRPTARRR